MKQKYNLDSLLQMNNPHNKGSGNYLHFKWEGVLFIFVQSCSSYAVIY